MLSHSSIGGGGWADVWAGEDGAAPGSQPGAAENQLKQLLRAAEHLGEAIYLRGPLS